MRTKHLFQSTLPARGATRCIFKTAHTAGHFNPRSPRGERLLVSASHIRQRVFQSTLPARGATPNCCPNRISCCISIHAPREGSDGKVKSTGGYRKYFNPRSPRGERLRRGCAGEVFGDISIHAPREGSDGRKEKKNGEEEYFNPRSPRGERLRLRITRSWQGIYFNPRSPRGERLKPLDTLQGLFLFQSTLPARGAT